MLSITHGTTGAFIAAKINNPYLAVPLIIISHFAQDYIPHWDVGQGMTKGLKSSKAAFWQELLVDFPLSILLVFFFFQIHKPFSPILWAGWFIGLLPDFLESPENFLKVNPSFLKPLSQLHHSLHHSIPNKFRGLIPQLLIILTIYIFR